MPPDAAALPSPPDIPPWKDRRPYSVGGDMHSNSQVTRLGSYQNGTPPSRPRYPHIKDLLDQAALSTLNGNLSVSNLSPTVGTIQATDSKTQLDVLLKTASEAIERAKDLADDDKSDKAYVQFLRASEITINVIPHHPDYKAITQGSGWYKEFAALMLVCL